MNMPMLCDDVRAESTELRKLVTRAGVDPAAVTPFQGWRVRDCIGHIVTIDRLALLTLTDVDAFGEARAAFAAASQATDASAPPEAIFARMAHYENGLFAHLDWAQLIATWAAGLDKLCAAAANRAPDDRVEWFGAPLRASTLLAARQMEIWAYGQDIFDLHRAERPESDRLFNIAEFAMRTFGFSFANRGLDIPAEKPFVVLDAPSGARWTWNDPGASDRIEGKAVDFCLVCTQRRHVADTGLTVRGPTAARWMSIAQCITGPALDGPPPRRIIDRPGVDR